MDPNGLDIQLDPSSSLKRLGMFLLRTKYFITVNYTVKKQLVSHGPVVGQCFAAAPYPAKLTPYRLSSPWLSTLAVPTIHTPMILQSISLQKDFNFIEVVNNTMMA